MNITWDFIASLIVALVFALISFFVVKKIYIELKTKKQGYPHEAAIEEALLPYVYRAIFVAYRMSEKSFDDLGKRLNGIDKRAVAQSVYRLLPDNIVIGGRSYSIVVVKSIITPARFTRLIETVFDGMLRFYYLQEGHFRDAYERWKELNKET